jgi:hypothetical protein
LIGDSSWLFNCHAGKVGPYVSAILQGRKKLMSQCRMRPRVRREPGIAELVEQQGAEGELQGISGRGYPLELWPPSTSSDIAEAKRTDRRTMCREIHGAAMPTGIVAVIWRSALKRAGVKRR